MPGVMGAAQSKPFDIASRRFSGIAKLWLSSSIEKTRDTYPRKTLFDVQALIILIVSRINNPFFDELEFQHLNTKHGLRFSD